MPPSYIRPSRSGLVAFFNELLSLDIKKIDDLGNGAVYCQVLDTIYGDVPLSKVNFDAKSSFEMQQNHKILQQIFLKHNIKYAFDSLKLMKCRLQDNLVFSQWIHEFWHENRKVANYDPIARRGGNAPLLKPKASVANLNASISRNGSSSSVNQRPNSIVNAPELRELKNSNLMLENRVKDLESELQLSNETINVLNAERENYYARLTEIEDIISDALHETYQLIPSVEERIEDRTMKLIRVLQTVLYRGGEDEENDTF